MDSTSETAEKMRHLYEQIYETDHKPKAILVVSAHWEGENDTIEVLASNKLLYDYYGFPPETYDIKYPCPTSSNIAEHVIKLVSNAGFQCKRNEERGFDHGVFIPLKLLYPAADIPVVQLSLHHSMDPAIHLKLGEAISSLRREGVWIIGSGQATHNLSLFFNAPSPEFPLGEATPWAQKFQDWMDSTLVKDMSVSQRRQCLEKWELAPEGRKAHPREEHLLPALVTAAAAGYTSASKLWQGWAGGHMSLASYIWKS